MKPFFSIIIPCRNNRETIKFTIKSLQGMNYPKNKFEVIIVDSSDDNTKNILYKIKSKNFRIINNPIKVGRNSNISRNIGARQSKYDNLIFLDADCTVSKNWLNDYAQYVEIDAAGGALKAKGTNMFSKYLNYSLMSLRLEPEREQIITAENFHKLQIPRGGNFFIKKSALKKAVFFDEKTPSFDEIELFYRLVRKGHKILIIPSANVETFSASELKTLLGSFIRWGKGLGYFTIKYTHSNYVKTRFSQFLIFDLLLLFYALLMSRYFQFGIYAIIASIFLFWIYYRIFVYRKSNLDILAFICFDVLAFVVVQFSAAYFILKSKVYSSFRKLFN